MTDLPYGKYSAILVGPFWPSSASVTASTNAARNRNSIQTVFDDYSNLLRSARSGALANMRGVTADNAHSAFKDGETSAGTVADKNRIKGQAFRNATNDLHGLRSDLTHMASKGETKIDAIMQSANIDKLSSVVAAIVDIHDQAARRSSQYVDSVLKGVEDILAVEGDPRSSEQFAVDNGIDLAKPIRPSETEIRAAVQPLLDQTSVRDAPRSSDEGYSKLSQSTSRSSNTQHVLPGGGRFDKYSSGASNPEQIPGFSSKIPADSPAQASGSLTTAALTHPTHAAPLDPSPTPTQISTTSGTSAIQAAPTAGLAHATPQAGLAVAPATGAPSGPTAPAVQPLGPQSIADGFTHGMQTNNPLTTFGESFSHTAASPTVTHHPEFSTPTGTLTPATSPSSGGFYGGEGAGSVAAAQSPAMTTAAAPSPTMIAAAPVPAAPSMTAGPPPMAPAGPLPTYGSDLRPAAAVISTPTTPPPPLASAPLSAPVNPASGAGGITQPAVVSKPAAGAASPAASPAAGVAESTLATTASGAAAREASAHRAAQSRLLRLVEAVARQQPRLRWAIGERDDGTTVLVTDLACGWIPPGVEIPVGIQLLPPTRRRGGLEALLGDAAIIETWTPGQYLPSAADAEPVSMSLRARDLPAVDDFNWQLTQTTNRRDGLPRLAHTLTKAGIAATGILDEESELLREHLRSASEAVLGSYADRIDTDAVGNWQLLTAIDALITGQKTALNYHFAWYHALNTAKQGYPS